MVAFLKEGTIFAQDDSADGVFFIQTGQVKLSVTSDGGKEATIGILGKGDFFGEGDLAGQHQRISSATALTDCVLLHIGKQTMMHAMSLEPKLSSTFVKYLVKRNIRYQDDLLDQLFNSSEKRLARLLLLMAQFGKEGVSETSVILRLSHETLSEMVGTTRARVSFFMNRFRKLGFVSYSVGDSLHVHSSLLTVLLHDDEGIDGVPGAALQERRKVQKHLQSLVRFRTKIVRDEQTSPVLKSSTSDARLGKERVSEILRRYSAGIVKDWLERVKRCDHLSTLKLSDAERSGHVAQIVEDLACRLRHSTASDKSRKTIFSDNAIAYGKQRYRQGYTPAMLVHESRILEVAIFGMLQNNRDSLDFSQLLPDVMAIADEVDAQLTQAMESYMQLMRKPVAA